MCAEDDNLVQLYTSAPGCKESNGLVVLSDGVLKSQSCTSELRIVNFHYQEKLKLFKECGFCFICMQNYCYMNGYSLIQLQS